MKKISGFLIVPLFICLLFSCNQSYGKKKNLLLGSWDRYTVINGKPLYVKASFKENTFTLYHSHMLDEETGGTIFYTYTR
ncbi:hypothetical protein DWQ65_05435 [Treponema phagedenis]|uniref:Lipoprotein n=1 Tax=Treponema phagedenis TaxID=162 RepID=A0A0B7GSM3_TREPH|nr:hypothetical protein [Treponema phagedenis]QEJ95116.1 hypothetical protein FUT79_07825 [Treponema phagedenis]QEK06049.1 hypothetical protein FUT80_04565 [Treponema phagedenis]QKS92367.1 hypothetical protein HPJ96_07265 [Treponema phagedenis]QSH94563.1 hypothetical protein C5O78_05820 [Treponema phagedenis]QSH99510.1 hypothetical protein DWQ65_05435 [Treponema phagedenis]